jgi:hypothetical protein
MRKVFLISLIIVLFCVHASSQDIGLFLESVPRVGSWAEYKVSIENSSGKTREYILRLAVTNSVKMDGQEYVLVEASPQKFLREKGGTLGLYLKAKPDGGEVSNIFLRARSIQYAPKNGEPYALDEFILGEIKAASKDFDVKRAIKIKEKKTGDLTGGKKCEITIEEREGLVDGSFGCSRLKVKEKGDVSLCADVPFGIVEANLLDEIYDSSDKIEKTKIIKIKLQSWGFDGAKSVFPDKDLKRKGIWGIIFS